TRALTNAGIFVHAYLMYGFPTQTTQETIDSLEVVRQLYLNGCIQSGFWHRFALTAHSPIAREPEKYGLKIKPRSLKARTSPKLFSLNDLEFLEKKKLKLEMLGDGLKKANYSYMLGAGLDQEIRFWFKQRVPRTTHSPRLIEEF